MSSRTTTPRRAARRRVYLRPIEAQKLCQRVDEAVQPNECWQTDVTHWRLGDGTDVEVLNWLDDHSRFLLGASAHAAGSGDDVARVFLELIGHHGAPAPTLTDNGMIFTTRFVGGRNAFEYLLRILGIR